MGKKIIVAGGGHGGIAAGAILASKGYDVTVYEKNKRENMGYDWTDIFAPSSIDIIGMPMPDKSLYRYKHDMTFYCPSLECALRQHTPEDQLEIQMERKDIYNCLISYAEDCGVKFEYETAVEGPILFGNRIVGIKTDKGDFYADLVIDAAGIDSPVRRNLPAYLGIQNEVGNFEQFYVFRAFFERTAEIPEDDFKVLLLHNNKLGISWVAAEEEHTDILIGRFAPLDMDQVNTELDSLRETQPALGTKILRGGQFVKIPVRQPLSVMVADGYAAIGDAAFMTVPLIGSGIANSFKAARFLADTVASDMNEEYSAETLYKYQRDFFNKLGAGLAPIACIKLLLTKLQDKDVDYLFKAGILTADDMTMGADTTSVVDLVSGMKPADLKTKAVGLINNPEMLKKIAGMGKQLAEAVSVCAALPKSYSKKGLRSWSKAYDKTFRV